MQYYSFQTFEGSEDAKELDHMHVSGGKLGMQLTLLPEDLAKAANAQFADVIHKD